MTLCVVGVASTTGHGAGIWTGGGVTRTKRNRTLFVTMVTAQQRVLHDCCHMIDQVCAGVRYLMV